MLDQPTHTDIDAIVEFCRDPVFEHFMTLPWPYEPAHAEYFVNEHVPIGWESDAEYTWAIRHSADGPLLGAIGLRVPSLMIGFWLGAPFRGQRIMVEALSGVLDWSFAHGVDAVAWEAVVGNHASLSVARAAGFSSSGVGPAVIEARDGTRPISWHGLIRSSDDRSPKVGWPLLDEPDVPEHETDRERERN